MEAPVAKRGTRCYQPFGSIYFFLQLQMLMDFSVGFLDGGGFGMFFAL